MKLSHRRIDTADEDAFVVAGPRGAVELSITRRFIGAHHPNPGDTHPGAACRVLEMPCDVSPIAFNDDAGYVDLVAAWVASGRDDQMFAALEAVYATQFPDRRRGDL